MHKVEKPSELARSMVADKLYITACPACPWFITTLQLWPPLTAAVDWICGWRGTWLVVWFKWFSLPSMMLDSCHCLSLFTESEASTLCSCRWPVIVMILDFGFSDFLTTVFWTEWLDNLFLWHILNHWVFFHTFRNFTDGIFTHLALLVPYVCCGGVVDAH